MAHQENSKAEEIKKMIINAFKFLEDQYLYIPTFKKDSAEIFLMSLEVEYINEIKKRKVAISYTKSNMDNEIRHTFTAAIIRIPYNNVDDFFSLDNYLKAKKNNFSTTIKNFYSKQEVEKILANIARALKENASPIIEGTEWLSTYYPRKD
jgi:hypothetical protein